MSGSLDARIRTELESHIRSGAWQPGHRLPVEHELMTRFGCSRATVSKAVAALVAAGLVERRKRAGSFVAQPRLHGAMLQIPDIATVLQARGERYRFELDARDVGAGKLHLRGVHVANDQPFAHEDREIDLKQVPEATSVDFTTEAPGSWLLRHVPWSEARHCVSAVNPTPAIARRLGLDTATACLRIERTTFRAGQQVTTVIQLFPGDRYDLTGQFGPG